MAFTEDEEKELKGFVAALRQVGSNAGFVVSLIPDIRANIITKAELDAALAGVGGAGVTRAEFDALLARFNTHRHAEGTTGVPNV